MDEHGYHDLLHQILKKQEATITAIAILNSSVNKLEGSTKMALDALQAELATLETAINQAITFIKGVPAQVQAAVDAATAGDAAAANTMIANMQTDVNNITAALNPPATP